MQFQFILLKIIESIMFNYVFYSAKGRLRRFSSRNFESDCMQFSIAIKSGRVADARALPIWYDQLVVIRMWNNSKFLIKLRN